VYSLLRFGIAYAILHCHVVTPTLWQLPTLFHNDLYPLGFITLLGLTQGHLLSTACMHAPALVPAGKEGEFGPVTGFAITAGSLMGSAALFFIMQQFTAPS
jgi:equilibrative nucleoside transporter 1/2/3